MAKRSAKTEKEPIQTMMRPALSPEAQENKMIALAEQEAERQIRAGTASSQVLSHYLKLGTMKHRLEMQKLEEENKLLRAKTEAIESSKNMEELYSKAIAAMMSYSGRDILNED